MRHQLFLVVWKEPPPCLQAICPSNKLSILSVPLQPVLRTKRGQHLATQGFLLARCSHRSCKSWRSPVPAFAGPLDRSTKLKPAECQTRPNARAPLRACPAPHHLLNGPAGFIQWYKRAVSALASPSRAESSGASGRASPMQGSWTCEVHRTSARASSAASPSKTPSSWSSSSEK